MTQRLEVLLRGIDKSFPGVRALRAVDFTLRSGEIHGLLGQNGAGKSTLLKVLGGVIAPDAGTVVVADQLVKFSSPADAQRAGVALVHQDGQLLPDLSVAENITAAASPAQWVGPLRVRDRGAARERAREHLRRLGIELDVRMPAGQLRAAERKLMEVARALATTDVRVLVLDEPTAALEPRETGQLFALLRRLRQPGVSIVFVSRKLDEVLQICDTITVLRDGAVIGYADVEDMQLEDLVALVAGGGLAQHASDTGEIGARALTIDGLTTGSVGPIDLDVHEGEVVALTGLLGSGNIEFARSAAGVKQARSGRVVVGPHVLRSGDRADATRRGLGFVPEDRKVEGIVPHLSVEKNIALAAIGEVSRRGALSRRRMRAQAEELIRRLDIRPPSPAMAAGNLSGGNQQKVLLARWLASRATVLVLEEPTHGLDVRAKREIQALLRRFVGDSGAVLMVSAELAELIQLSDRIGVFRGGRLVTTLPRGVTEQELTAQSVGTPSEAAP